jgi:hypothetical protein
VVSDNNSNPPRPKRRWYQYSLRTLFVLTALVAAVFAYHKARTRRYEAQQRAINAIRTMGGKVQVDYEAPGWWQRLLGPAYSTIDTASVRFIHPFGSVSVDDVPREYVDQVRSAFKENGQVPPSPLFGEPLGDDKLAALAACLRDVPHVKQVVLTRAILASRKWWLRNETAIELYVSYLRLYTNTQIDTQITDQGLRHLSALREVEVLVLQGSNISDEGLKHLEGLTSLRKLWLICPRVTPEGVGNLQRALPKCTIQR